MGDLLGEGPVHNAVLRAWKAASKPAAVPANFTGAGLGAKSDRRRNFEAGVLTDDDEVVDPDAGDELPDLGVLGVVVLAEFAHAAEDCDATAVTRRRTMSGTKIESCTLSLTGISSFSLPVSKRAASMSAARSRR